MITIKRAWPYSEPIERTWPSLNYPGFFRKSWRIDRLGLWNGCSLGTPEGKELWRAYTAPVPADKLLRGSSKYDQPRDGWTSWTGVVLAAQSAGAAVTQATPSGSNKEYLEFVEKACRYFRERLLIKLHPKCGEGMASWHQTIAERYRCRCGYFNSSILEECEFVLTFSSNYAVDAWLRGVNVMQYAPGCFSHTGAVTFTDWRIHDRIEDRLEAANQLLDFCVWRYNFSIEMPERMIEEVVAKYVADSSLYPLPEDLSYGAWASASEARSISTCEKEA